MSLRALLTLAMLSLCAQPLCGQAVYLRPWTGPFYEGDDFVTSIRFFAQDASTYLRDMQVVMEWEDGQHWEWSVDGGADGFQNHRELFSGFWPDNGFEVHVVATGEIVGEGAFGYESTYRWGDDAGINRPPVIDPADLTLREAPRETWIDVPFSDPGVLDTHSVEVDLLGEADTFLQVRGAWVDQDADLAHVLIGVISLPVLGDNIFDVGISIIDDDGGRAGVGTTVLFGLDSIPEPRLLGTLGVLGVLGISALRRRITPSGS